MRFLDWVGGSKIERAKINRIVIGRIHDVKSDSNETALGRLALTFCIELDDPLAEFKVIKPDDILPSLVELDGGHAIPFNLFDGIEATLPSYPFRNAFQVD